MLQEDARPATNSASYKQPSTWWKTRNQRRRRQDFNNLVEQACLRLSYAPEMCRMLRMYAKHERLTQPEERAALHNAQCHRDKTAFDDLILSLTPIALRPLLATDAFDRYLDDAVQESIVAMMEYLSNADVADPSHWQSALGFVPMNARMKVALEGQATAGISYSRKQRSIVRRFILQPELLDCDECTLREVFPKNAWDDILLVKNSLQTMPVAQAPITICDTTKTSDAKLDAERLRDWVQSNLTSRHLRIFDLRLLTDDPLSYDECGQALELSGERVRQLEKDLLKQLRQAYENDLSRP
jgi:hypothetical protein